MYIFTPFNYPPCVGAVNKLVAKSPEPTKERGHWSLLTMPSEEEKDEVFNLVIV